MKVRSVLLALAMAAAGTVAATPAAASNSCPSSDPLGSPSSGVVSSSDPVEWYSLSTSYPVEMRMDPGVGGKADMKIRNAACSASVCSFSGGFGGAQECDIPAGTYNVGVEHHSGGSVHFYLRANYYQCADGLDNEGDGRTDYPTDPGCTGARDNTENSEPACSNNLDDDADGVTDYPGDPGCTSATDTVEGSSECSDGVDNDDDGRADHPSDAGCTSARDESEGVECTTASGVSLCAGYSVGPEVTRLYVVSDVDSPSVAAYLDVYRFSTSFGDVNVPCLVFTTGAASGNPCASLGATFVSRSLTLAEQPVNTPDPTEGPPVTSVGVCGAELELTVNRIGLASLPAYIVC